MYRYNDIIIHNHIDLCLIVRCSRDTTSRLTRSTPHGSLAPSRRPDYIYIYLFCVLLFRCWRATTLPSTPSTPHGSLAPSRRLGWCSPSRTPWPCQSTSRGDSMRGCTERSQVHNIYRYMCIYIARHDRANP